jgi:hypothetical protein
LIRKEDATEANFFALLRYFDARYLDTESLHVSCETSLRFMLGNYLTQHDIDAIREALQGRTSEYKPRVWEADAQAVLDREGTTEEIRYKLEGGDLRDLKRVELDPRQPCADCASSHSGLVGSGNASPQPAGLGNVPCYFLLDDFKLDGRRFIRVFINEEDGSVESLLTLLDHFSNKRDGAEALVVKVLTSMDQERDPLGPSMKEHLVGALFRDDVSAVIRYRRPHEEGTTIVVRGTDTFPDLDDARGTAYPWMTSTGVR